MEVQLSQSCVHLGMPPIPDTNHNGPGLHMIFLHLVQKDFGVFVEASRLVHQSYVKKGLQKEHVVHVCKRGWIKELDLLRS